MDQVYCREYDSMSSVSDSEDDAQNVNSNRKPLYSGTSVSVEDSILSIMKYSLKHKTTYAAISDLLELISLHLPYGSNKEHLRSLYFLKKAFAATEDQDEFVAVHYYCQSCFFLAHCKSVKTAVDFVEKQNYQKERIIF